MSVTRKTVGTCSTAVVVDMLIRRTFCGYSPVTAVSIRTIFAHIIAYESHALALLATVTIACVTVSAGCAFVTRHVLSVRTLENFRGTITLIPYGTWLADVVMYVLRFWTKRCFGAIAGMLGRARLALVRHYMSS